MNRTYFLPVLVSGMALLLFPAQVTKNVWEQETVRRVQKDEAPRVEVDINRAEPEPDIEGDMDVDVNADVNVNVDVEEPQVEMDVDRGEPEMDIEADPEQVDIDIDHDEAGWTEREQEKIEKSFAMPPPAGRRSLEIDNVWGSIEVVGTGSDRAQVTVNKSIRAESKGKIEQARKDVTLDVTQQGDALRLYVNGPFRCDCHDCERSRDDQGYIVKMDFQVQVPRDIDIKIKTVNDGHVSVRDINGSFLVRNVNGDIQIRDIAGSGTARTVNGPVKVSFRQNPREASDFETVNGAVELAFAHDLAADFKFKTFNGGIYSDFPVTALPVEGMKEEHHGAKVVFRADRYTGARVNSGGPQIKVENLNGDIRILENHE
jgi:putative adhesin